MKKQFLLLAGFLVTASVVFSQQPVVAPPESLVVEGVPAIPTGVAETAGRYGAYRSAAVADWHPTERSILINTRFAETPQRRDLRRAEYGDERDPKMHEFLERIAPMNNIAKIKKPMLVIAGKNDPRVPVSESDQIVAALKKQGTPVWYIMAKDEGHGFQKKPNQDYQFYAVVEFLEEFLLK